MFHLAILKSNRVAGDKVESYTVPKEPPVLSLCCLLVNPGATTGSRGLPWLLEIQLQCNSSVPGTDPMVQT